MSDGVSAFCRKREPVDCCALILDESPFSRRIQTAEIVLRARISPGCRFVEVLRRLLRIFLHADSLHMEHPEFEERLRIFPGGGFPIPGKGGMDIGFFRKGSVGEELRIFELRHCIAAFRGNAIESEGFFQVDIDRSAIFVAVSQFSERFRIALPGGFPQQLNHLLRVSFHSAPGIFAVRHHAERRGRRVFQGNEPVQDSNRLFHCAGVILREKQFRKSRFRRNEVFSGKTFQLGDGIGGEGRFCGESPFLVLGNSMEIGHSQLETGHLYTGVGGFFHPAIGFEAVFFDSGSAFQADCIIVHGFRHAGIGRFFVPVGGESRIRETGFCSVEIFIAEFEHGVSVSIGCFGAERIIFPCGFLLGGKGKRKEYQKEKQKTRRVEGAPVRRFSGKAVPHRI